MYDARSPALGIRISDGATSTRGADGGAVALGAIPCDADAGGDAGAGCVVAVRAGGAAGVVRDGRDGIEGAVAGGPAGGDRRTISVSCSGWARLSMSSRGNQCHMTATCNNSDSTIASQIVGIVTPSRLEWFSNIRSVIGQLGNSSWKAL